MFVVLLLEAISLTTCLDVTGHLQVYSVVDKDAAPHTNATATAIGKRKTSLERAAVSLSTRPVHLKMAVTPKHVVSEIASNKGTVNDVAPRRRKTPKSEI
jgi:hypothetical protein